MKRHNNYKNSHSQLLRELKTFTRIYGSYKKKCTIDAIVQNHHDKPQQNLDLPRKFASQTTVHINGGNSQSLQKIHNPNEHGKVLI